MKLKSILNYFTKTEKILWCVSILIISASFFFFTKRDYLTLVASLVGVTSLIFSAKCNPLGQVLMIIFSLMYGFISFKVAYYGEMLTYLGMTLPMSVTALITWVKNPFKGDKLQVQINRITKKETAFMLGLSIGVTVAFYFILKYFNTQNLLPSTISVTTSFIAAYLTFRRNPFFALAYALNDVVLIVLWVMLSFYDISYISVVICFLVFLINDLYGFINWKRIEIKQTKEVFKTSLDKMIYLK